MKTKTHAQITSTLDTNQQTQLWEAITQNTKYYLRAKNTYDEESTSYN